MTYALLLGFFRNDFGFGGNNGLTDFKDILGFNVQTETTRNALLVISCLMLALGFLICRAIVTSKFGKVLVAIRDAESAHALPRLPGGVLQAVRVHAVGLHGRHCRRALCASGRHHQSERIRARQLDRGRDLGRGRRARHAHRRGARRLRGQLRQDLFHLRLSRALLAVHARRPVRRHHAADAARHHRHLQQLAAPRADVAAAVSAAKEDGSMPPAATPRAAE